MSGFADAVPASSSEHPVRGHVVAITTAALHPVSVDERLTRLREQLAERDEIIVALQYVICDLRHEIDNLRAEQMFGAPLESGPARRSVLMP